MRFVKRTKHRVNIMVKYWLCWRIRTLWVIWVWRDEFVEDAKTGLRCWVDGGKDGQLEWGFLSTFLVGDNRERR